MLDSLLCVWQSGSLYSLILFSRGLHLRLCYWNYSKLQVKTRSSKFDADIQITLAILFGTTTLWNAASFHLLATNEDLNS